jgi:hypothetical protein
VLSRRGNPTVPGGRLIVDRDVAVVGTDVTSLGAATPASEVNRVRLHADPTILVSPSALQPARGAVALAA